MAIVIIIFIVILQKEQNLNSKTNNIMTYTGNRVVNANNGICAVLILVAAVLAIKTSNINDRYFFLIIIPVVFLITAAETFYFEITVDELVIKNYMVPFINIQYQLNEITQIQLLNTNTKSTAKARLKVIRGDKRSMGFYAASLGVKDWQLFINDLKKHKIDIYIESVSLKSEVGVPE